MVVGAVIFGATLLYCTYCKKQEPYGELLSADSTHSESGDALYSFSAGRNNDSEHGAFPPPPLNLGHASSSTYDSATQHQQTTPTPPPKCQSRRTATPVNPDKLRSLLARSADFLTSRRKSPRVAPGGHERSRRGYDAVRSPFSIVGEEDDDDAGFEDSDEDGNGRPYDRDQRALDIRV
jgi:hypothetical protein